MLAPTAMLPLVFLPAMPCDARLYQAQIDALSDVVDPMAAVLAEASFAASAERLLSQVRGRFLLAGTAYGGCLAMEICAKAPDRVAGLWLMNCNPGAHPDPAGVRLTSARIRQGEHDVVIREFAEKAIPSEDQASRAMFTRMARDVGPEIFARQSDAALTRRDHWGTMASAAVPTLLIWGAADTFVPIEVGQRLARILPDARFEALAGCGHFPSMERPEATTAIARGWLSDRRFR